MGPVERQQGRKEVPGVEPTRPARVGLVDGALDHRARARAEREQTPGWRSRGLPAEGSDPHTDGREYARSRASDARRASSRETPRARAAFESGSWSSPSRRCSVPTRRSPRRRASSAADVSTDLIVSPADRLVIERLPCRAWRGRIAVRPRARHRSAPTTSRAPWRGARCGPPAPRPVGGGLPRRAARPRGPRGRGPTPAH